MSKPHDALVQSVKARLVQRAHAEHLEPNQVLTRFSIERFLYRLSKSRHGNRFLLKGSNLLLVWFGAFVRPTRDADLLGLGDFGAELLGKIFRDVCETRVEPDGMIFDPASVTVRLIRRDQPAGGHRVNLLGRLGKARLYVQIDVGLGDSVMPPPEWLDFPSILDHPRPRLRAYRPETTIAEKLHAMVTLGARTTRLRDFFDLRLLAREKAFDAALLVPSVRTTFQSRGTPLPSEIPTALTPAFSRSSEKQTQWRAFLRKSGLEDAESDLGVVVDDLVEFLLPVLDAARDPELDLGTWPAGGPWCPLEVKEEISQLFEHLERHEPEGPRAVPGPEIAHRGTRLVARPMVPKEKRPQVNVARAVEEERERNPVQPGELDTWNLRPGQET